MKYISTRGGVPALGFEEVLLAGLARDGGLYLPEKWPHFSSEEISAFSGRPYCDVAETVMCPFIGDDIDPASFREIIDEAYREFRHPAVTPLVEIAPNQWILELFHGPTLAFKDLAMQLLSRLMDQALKKKGRRATIVGATSGDTGGAAIEAFRGLEQVDIFILHPHNRVSDVQRRQMTTAQEANVHNIAIEGTFDDCQALVKDLFCDFDLRDRLHLGGVNSINWARIMAQIVYYFTAASALGSPLRPVNFSVPTGNFGDIFAGFAAREMGLPIDHLLIATNVNDILARVLQTGCYQPRQVIATDSPSMDIQISSNFERLIYQLAGRKSERVNELMETLQREGHFQLNEKEQGSLRGLFSAETISQDETAATLRKLSQSAGYIADPHTAVAVGAAWKAALSPEIPMVILATAHPAKFPALVAEQTGKTPAWPERLSDPFSRPERFDVLSKDYHHLMGHIMSRVENLPGQVH